MCTLLKVCGLINHPENYPVARLAGLTYVGFIFVETSPRFTRETFPTSGIKRTGVFVDAKPSFIREMIRKHQLDAVQLHGNESPEECRELQSLCEVIKSFGIGEHSDLAAVQAFHGNCDLFLFDTKTTHHGGSGRSFDWQILAHYEGPTPFILSGGIGLSSLEELRHFSHPLCIGLDLNSCFELQAGIKNHQLIQTFIHELNSSHFSKS